MEAGVAEEAYEAGGGGRCASWGGRAERALVGRGLLMASPWGRGFLAG